MIGDVGATVPLAIGFGTAGRAVPAAVILRHGFAEHISFVAGTALAAPIASHSASIRLREL